MITLQIFGFISSTKSQKHFFKELTRTFEQWHLRIWINRVHILSSPLQHGVPTMHLMFHMRRLHQCCFCSSVSCVSEKSKICFHHCQFRISHQGMGASKLYANNQWIYTKENVFLFNFILVYGVETTEKWLLTIKPTPFPLLHSAKKGQGFKISL